MNRRTVVISVVAGVVVIGGAGAGVAWQQQRAQAEQDRSLRAAAETFASAWSDRALDRSGTSYSGSSPAQVAASFTRVTQGLGTGPVKVTVGSVNRSGDTGKATLDVRWSLAGGATWAYSEPVSLKRTSNRWAVVADGPTSLWHPKVRSNQALTAGRTWGRRGAVLDRNGKPLLAIGTVYDVQIDPARATPAAVAALEKVVDEPAGSLTAKLAAAKRARSRAPIPVITYREGDFADRRAALEPLAGVIYPRREQPLAPTRTFGQPLLGSYGPVTAEMVSKGKGRYVAGDHAGLSGIQGQYDELLGGTAGVAVAVAGTNPATTLFEQPAKDGKDLTLALDPAVQTAAEKALAGSGATPSALVAVDVKTGDLIAVANSPELGFDRALVGQYQPGSTLKVATSYSLLGKGLSPSTRVPCPPSVTVDGLTVQELRGRDVRRRPLRQGLRPLVQHGVRPARRWHGRRRRARRGQGARGRRRLGEAPGRRQRVRRLGARRHEQDREGGHGVRPGPDADLPCRDGGHGRIGGPGQLRGARPGHLTRGARRRPHRETAAGGAGRRAALADAPGRDRRHRFGAEGRPRRPGVGQDRHRGARDRSRRRRPGRGSWGGRATWRSPSWWRRAAAAAPSPRRWSRAFLTDAAPLTRKGSGNDEAPDLTVGGFAKSDCLSRSSIRLKSEGANLVSLRALRALGDLELDALCLVERTVAVGLDRRVVNEDVGASAILCDEAEALFSVEPLHGALCHGDNSFFDSQWSSHLARPRLPHYPHNYRDMPVSMKKARSLLRALLRPARNCNCNRASRYHFSGSRQGGLPRSVGTRSARCRRRSATCRERGHRPCRPLPALSVRCR